MPTLCCDYLVIGASLSGLGFVDAVTQWDQESTFIIVDRYGKAGGRLNVLPRFCELEDNADTWGVTSRRFAARHGTVDEQLMYCQKVMDDLIKTGRVRFFPKFEANVEGTTLTSVLDADTTYNVSTYRKVVDARCSLPRTPRGPERSIVVKEGAKLVRPDRLAYELGPHPRYVVIGAGPVGVRTVLYLLGAGVSAGRITWVVPRAKGYMAKEFQAKSARIESQKANQAILCTFPSVNMYELMLEEAGVCHRLHESRKPEHMAHHVNLSMEEIQTLREVKTVVRMGYVRAVGPSCIELDQGTFQTEASTLYIDCSGGRQSFRAAPVVPFAPGRLTLQRVREASCKSHSAATVALVEVKSNLSDDEKNKLCTPGYHAETSEEVLLGSLPPCNASVWAKGGLLDARLSLRTNMMQHASWPLWYTVGTYERMAEHIQKVMVAQSPAAIEEYQLTLAAMEKLHDNGSSETRPRADSCASCAFFDFEELDETVAISAH